MKDVLRFMIIWARTQAVILGLIIIIAVFYKPINPVVTYLAWLFAGTLAVTAFLAVLLWSNDQ